MMLIRAMRLNQNRFGLQNQNNGLKEAKRFVQLIRTAESVDNHH